MGFQFIDAETRNPTPQPPSHEELQSEKLTQKEMICADIQAKLSELEEFIDENRLLQKFFAWQALREQMKDTSAEVIE